MKLLKRVLSFKFAIEGIFYAAKTQWNFRFHLLATGIVLCAASYLGVSTLEWIALLFCISMVLASELINTAIESSVDLFTKEHRAMAKAAKDTAAGAVLIASIFSAIIGTMIFLPKIF